MGNKEFLSNFDKSGLMRHFFIVFLTFKLNFATSLE